MTTPTITINWEFFTATEDSDDVAVSISGKHPETGKIYAITNEDLDFEDFHAGDGIYSGSIDYTTVGAASPFNDKKKVSCSADRAMRAFAREYLMNSGGER